MLGRLMILLLLSGCMGQGITQRGYDQQAWQNAPTLHDVPDEAEPLDKEQLTKKAKELTDSYHKHSVGLTVASRSSR